MDTMTAATTSPARGVDRLLGPYAALRANRNLAWLFGGQLVSALGGWLYLSALVVLVYDLTRSPTLAAALTGVRLLPYVLGLPLGGILADRLDRRAVMIGADLGRAEPSIGGGRRAPCAGRACRTGPAEGWPVPPVPAPAD